ncbi:hypothetical protein LCGC14_1537100 [marine sediment metagenome]|uniref:Uncharacterized protein n=1 Tax=marine sediment metagenome TaxID=412755 RepID=A0A0F9IU80_9ZZZZ
MCPLYEYQCYECFERFDKVVSIGARNSVTHCGQTARLLVSLSTFKIYNPFTKDGEGFTSKMVSKQEANERAKAGAGKYD